MLFAVFPVNVTSGDVTRKPHYLRDRQCTFGKGPCQHPGWRGQSHREGRDRVANGPPGFCHALPIEDQHSPTPQWEWAVGPTADTPIYAKLSQYTMPDLFPSPLFCPSMFQLADKFPAKRPFPDCDVSKS